MIILKSHINKHASLQPRNTKTGSTLVELIAVVAILGIISAGVFTTLFSVSNLYKKVNDVSSSQRISALVHENLSLYANTAVNIKSKGKADLNSPSLYDITSKPNGFQDADNYSSHDYVDYFIRSVSAGEIEICKFNAVSIGGSYGYKTVVQISGVKEITFNVVSLNSSSGYSMLNYSVTTETGYTIDGGVVLNNSEKMAIPSFTTPMTIATDTAKAENNNVLNITSTSRQNVNR